MKQLFAVLLALCTSAASAQVLEVNIWKPTLGGAAATMAAADQAQSIINDAGGNASIGVDLDGSLHFVTHHEDWAAWAKQAGMLSENESWGKFVARWNDDPSAKLDENYLLNVVVPGGDGPVYQVFIWEARPGRMSSLFEGAAQAKALHEEDGAAVTIYSDQMNRLHYAMSFESWDAWAAFQDGDHPEFDAFMQKAMEDPSGKLVEVYTASMQ